MLLMRSQGPVKNAFEHQQTCSLALSAAVGLSHLPDSIYQECGPGCGPGWPSPVSLAWLETAQQQIAMLLQPVPLPVFLVALF
jgi:hypothetical protein